jgi:hypothetical protein
LPLIGNAQLIKRSENVAFSATFLPRGATFRLASVLLRSHLRQLTPLPKDELIALKRSIAELGSTGRNINQIARAVSGGVEVAGSLRGIRGDE